jgi:hypothetical protein
MGAGVVNVREQKKLEARKCLPMLLIGRRIYFTMNDVETK